ncbi:MAG: carbon starvation protein A [Kiritimatiellae bacterium]|nr:carbon starvation protein A [Kiritimatiellia bacterium]
MIAWVFLLVCILFAGAYVFYGRFLDRHLGVVADKPTPAHVHRDGVDYVATSAPVLFGHHFSSIAGAGPIVGPIVAGAAFGWLPTLAWIVIGAIFVGGVHDYASLMASLRHKGRSIGEICKAHLSPLTYYLFLLFIWFTLVYVLIVFLDLVAVGFAPADAALQHDGGAVATASVLYIVIAIAFGLATYRFKLGIGKATLLFVPLVFASLWAGIRLPILADKLPVFLGSVKNTWCLLLLVYCFIASITPVWILLQPRDYLSSFLLYACLVGGALGLLISGFSGLVPARYPMLVTFKDAHLGLIFPALFITVACGAVSGFHSLVASGTTSKQLARESSARGIAYGSMLVEGLLAAVALATVMILSAKPAGSPQATFARGVGTFLATLGIPENVATVFGLLAVTSFLLTTLDTCTRLARFVFQELFQWWNAAGRVVGTCATLALPALVVFRQVRSPTGKLIPAWQAIWPAFGTTNQLMAALALLVVFVWLRRNRRKTLYVLLPLLFMCVTTLTSLCQLIWLNLFGQGSPFVGWLSAALLVMAVVVMINSARSLSGPDPGHPAPPLPSPEA